MRFDGPTNSLVRNVERDHKLHDKELKKGDRVFAMVSSANRDENIFSEPDTFKVDRSPNRHLTFGYGPHLCIGAALAREEGRIAINNFFKHYPKTKLKAENSYQWIDAMVPRGLKTLDVRLT